MDTTVEHTAVVSRGQTGQQCFQMRCYLHSEISLGAATTRVGGWWVICFVAAFSRAKIGSFSYDSVGFFLLFFTRIYFPASGQAVVTGVVPSPPRFLPSLFIAHRVQQSHCSSIFHRVLLTNALGPSASQLVHKEKSQRIYTGMHSAGLELTGLNYHGLEDNLTRHRGDRTHGQGGRPRLAGLSLSLHPPPVFSPCIRTCTWVVRAMYS